jgi:subtilase family serine protease
MDRGFGRFTAVMAAACLSLTTLTAAQRATKGYQAPSENKQASAAGQSMRNAIVPQSSVDRGPGFFRTHLKLASEDGVKPKTSVVPSITMTETPASMGCVYKVGPAYTGCLPSTGGTRHPVGGWGAIAIVDAFDNPYAAAELATFDAAFGLPAASFVKVYANGNGACTVPPVNAGWGLEESLDIEWAHVMAPNAVIILVEACDNSFANMYYAEQVAGSWVQAYGGGNVTNSWGAGEYAGETNDDNNFYRYYWQNISYFASAGDSGCGAAYPSSSPWVVSAGGTTVNRNPKNGNFSSESCWAGSGGGSSGQEAWQSPPNILNGMGPWSTFQYPIFGQATRQTPDMSFNADPASGVIVFDCAYYSGSCYYFAVGGTSVSSPALAGIVNQAGNKLGQAPFGGGYYSNTENNLIYSNYFGVNSYKKNYYDVKAGSNGCSVGAGWDYCTGVGSPRGLLGK